LPNRNETLVLALKKPDFGKNWRAGIEKSRPRGALLFRMPFQKRAARTAVEILLVEDSRGDIRLMQEAFREARCCARWSIAHNGRQALAYLRRESPYQAASRPSLILLDLNLPGANGGDLLAEIKNQRDLRQIPVIVLSTSTRAEDIAQAYDLHANCYVSKPGDLESLVDLIHMIEAFWLGTAALAEAGARPRAFAARK
jgi:CheY-like chemotaxis protein